MLLFNVRSIMNTLVHVTNKIGVLIIIINRGMFSHDVSTFQICKINTNFSSFYIRLVCKYIDIYVDLLN